MKQKGSITFHFVPFPQEIWDSNLELSMGEFRLLGYLLRYYVRWGKSRQIRLSDDEILHGRKAKEHRSDHGCGLSINAFKDARTRLLDKGWIEFKEDLTDKARPKRWYAINEDLFNEERQVSKFDSRVSDSDSEVSEYDTRSDSRSLLVKENTPIVPSGDSSEAGEKNGGGEQPRRSKRYTDETVLSVEELVKLYHDLKPTECPRVRVISNGRRKKYEEYLKQFPTFGFWADVFTGLTQPWMRGLEPSPGHEAFVVDLDWLCQKGSKDGVENCLKIKEGRYEHKKPPVEDPLSWYADDPDNPLSRDPD